MDSFWVYLVTLGDDGLAGKGFLPRRCQKVGGWCASQAQEWRVPRLPGRSLQNFRFLVPVNNK